MVMSLLRSLVAVTGALACWAVLVASQVPNPAATVAAPAFSGTLDDPGIRYLTGPLSNDIDRLGQQLDAGRARFAFEGRSGYLRSVLAALKVPVDSQMLVYSRASFQGRHVTEKSPRAIFYNDTTQVAWVRDADVLELATQDPERGTVFYTLRQASSEKPHFQRATVCLGCHRTRGTLEIPGLVLFSALRLETGGFGPAAYMTPSTLFDERFGGWFVTGASVPSGHRGNDAAALGGRPLPIASVDGLFDRDGYPGNTSDIAALLVFTHQVHVVNLLVRANFAARVTHPGKPDDQDGLARALADALLFVDETPLPQRVMGTSGFAERFSSVGPMDRRGRTLRTLDLTTRLMRYPCSYLIHSPMFEALPSTMRNRVYDSMWQVLSGANADPRYRHVSRADRQAIVEILLDTRPGWPATYARVTR